MDELDYDEDLVYTWKGRRFTGIGYGDDLKQGYDELRFYDGAQHGPSRNWYPSGRLQGEMYYYENTLHGPQRDYDEQGVLRLERFYDHGTVVKEVTRNASGEIVEVFEIDRGSDQYRRLERWRQLRPWPPPSNDPVV